MSRYCSVIGCKSDDTYKNIKYFFDYICVKVTTYFFNMHDDIVKELDEHGVNLIKKICSCYTSIRLKHHARLQNQKLKKTKMRTKLNKMILHTHQ